MYIYINYQNQYKLKMMNKQLLEKDNKLQEQSEQIDKINYANKKYECLCH